LFNYQSSQAKYYSYCLTLLIADFLHVQIHTKKKNGLENQRLNKLVYVSYNRKMKNRFANIRELGCKAKKSNPLMLEEFLWQNEWVEDCHEGDGDDANIWTVIDDATGATQGLRGQNLPRSGVAGSGNATATSSPVHTYVRTRKRPKNAPTIDISEEEEDNDQEEQHIDQSVEAETTQINEEESKISSCPVVQSFQEGD
jgi:hypothetical protein